MPEVLIKFLDWPFLLFLLLIIFGYNFQDNIRSLFSRGEITIAWGKDRVITLKELSQNLDKEIEPLQDEVKELREMLEKLQAVPNRERESGLVPASRSGESISKGGLQPLSLGDDGADEEPASERDEQAALKRMKEALASGDFRWRSIRVLAGKAGLSEEKALILLRQDQDVEFGTGKSGNQIVKLKGR